MMIKPQLLSLPEQVVTERLMLRNYREGEGQFFFDLVRRNIERFRIAVPEDWLAMQTPDDGEVHVREFIARWYLRECFFFSMWHRESGTYMGHIPLFDLDWHVPRIEIGYIIGQEYEGRGYVTEGARACVRFAFEHLKVNKMLLTCREDNTRSYRTAERIGFMREGLQRDHIVRGDGSLTGRLCYGITRADYERLVPTWS
jgi:ribosomal-protein-serine acetyltransferase